MNATGAQNDVDGEGDGGVRSGESDVGHPEASDRPLGISLLIWLYWFWAGAVAMVFLAFAVGEGPVPMSGETLPRSEALARVLPVLLPMGLAVLGAALALTLRRPWARPAVLLPVALAAFGPALSGVGTTRSDIVIGALAVLPVLVALVWYLYRVPGVTAYFAGLKDPEDRVAG